MKNILLAAIAATLILTSGCKSSPRQSAQLSTYIATTIIMEERPDARPYLLTLTPAVCTMAQSTNPSTANLVLQLESIPNTSPYGQMFFNTAVLGLLWSYDGKPESREVYLGVCDGLNMGLMTGARTRNYPHLRMR